jgi:hypothetical protein
MTVRRALLSIAAISLSVTALAQTADEVEFWSRTVATGSIEAVTRELQQTSHVKWPHIDSSFAYEQMTGDGKLAGTNAVALAENLRQLLDSSFKADSNLTESSLRTELGLLSTISRALSDGGGYSNQVLQDSISRLMIFRLSAWTIEHPQQAAAAEKYLETIDVSQLHIRQLLMEFAEQDPELLKKRGEINKINDDLPIYRALEPLGLSIKDVGAFIDPKQTQTSMLLTTPNVPALAFRMAETESLKWINLRGLIEFLKSGGSFDELDPADIRAFQARMGKNVSRYKYSPLGIKRLSESQLSALVSLHRDQNRKRIFLQVALK